MKLLLLLGLAVAWWAWRSAKLGRVSHGHVAAAVGAVIALALFRKGEVFPALLGAGGVAAWAWWRNRNDEPMLGEAEARRVLELPLGASEGQVREAHRRLIARVHPDAGGSEALAARVNAARDALLAELRRA